MAAPKKSTAGRLKIGSNILPTTDLNYEVQVDAQHARHSGQLMPSNVMVAGVGVPTIRARMPLDAALDEFGLGTNAHGSSDTVEALFLNVVGGKVDSSATHVKYAKSTSCLATSYIASFDVSEGGEAIAEVVIHFWANDGDTDPITDTGSIDATGYALSSQPNNHGIGTLTINGTAFDGVTGVSYQAGIDFAVQRTDGKPFPTGGAPSGFQPVLAVQLADPVTLQATLGSIGVSESSNVVVTLKKYANSTLSATGQITLTIGAGYIRPLTFGGPHGDLARGGCEILGASTDGSTHPIAVS